MLDRRVEVELEEILADIAEAESWVQRHKLALKKHLKYNQVYCPHCNNMHYPLCESKEEK